MYRIIKRLWEMPPSETAHKVIRRLSGRNGEFDVQELARSTRQMRPQRFYDFLSRYEAILERHVGWEKLEFEGRHVLEVGCGPLLGFGLIALYRGAASYSAMEPQFDPRVLDEPAIVNTYFLGVFNDLSAIYGPRYEFREFMELLKNRTRVTAEPLLETPLTGPFDVVLSNSCLEHIFDFEASMRRLRQLCAADYRYLHLVNFSSHRAGKNPFAALYATDADSYAAQFGNHINLLRPPDILAALTAAGFAPQLAPYVNFKGFFEGPIHESWAKRYSEEELFLHTAIIFGPTAPPAAC